MNTTLPSSIFDELAALSEPRSKAEKRNASEVQEQIVVDAKGDTLSSTKYKRSRRRLNLISSSYIWQMWLGSMGANHVF